MAGDHAEQVGRIAHVRGKGPHAVKRRGKRDQPVAGNAPVGGQNADNAAKAGRLANGATGVGAQGRHGQLAATAAAEPPLDPPGTRSGSTGLRTGP